MVSFAVLQIVEPIMHALTLPESTLKLVVVLLGLGFPVAVVLAWAFDLNEGKIERTPPLPGSAPRAARLGILLVGVGVLAAAPGVAWYLFLRKPTQPAPGAAAPASSIAVLPFVNLSSEGVVQDTAGMVESRALAEKARELQPDLPELAEANQKRVEYEMGGDARPLVEFLAKWSASDRLGNATLVLWKIAMIGRRFDEAIAVLRATPLQMLTQALVSKASLRGQALSAAGRTADARAAFEEARADYERLLRMRPDDALGLMHLAQVDASLGARNRRGARPGSPPRSCPR